MRHTKSRRRLFFLALAVLWAAGLVVTILWFRLVRSADPVEGPVPVGGLADSVTVAYDTLGIPTVRARSELDAWRALGYLHASDRTWQLEFFRRIAEGRLSELFGPVSYPTDRFVRTLGLGRIAADAVERLTPEERLALDAYAGGVNARLTEKRPLPPEFQILRFEPETWTPKASLSVALVMNLDLSHWRRDLSRHWAAANLPPEKAAYLHPRYPDWGPRTLDGVLEPPEGVVTGFEPVGAGEAASGTSAPSGSAEALAASEWDPLKVLSAASIRVASNAWVVGSTRTASGNPILANDMHLALRAPSIWYVAALHAPADGLDAAGFTLPGVPGVIAGFNRRVAWGLTNGMIDDMDFVVETPDASGSRYRNGDAWLEFAARPETIQVRGEGTRVETVRSTMRGPVISDVLTDVDGTLTAMFLPAAIGVGLEGLFAMNRARSPEEFQRASASFSQPHLNFVVAGADGRIGYRLAGSVPLRSWDGALPVPAAAVGDGWAGVWPPAAHPVALAPVRDFIATANNLQVEGMDGAIGADWPVPFRAERITRALAVRRDWTLETTAELQRDVRSLLADRTMSRAVAAARRIGDEGAAARLSSWDRMVTLDSDAAPIFYTWFYGLRVLVAADEWAAAPGRALFPTLSMLQVLAEGDANPWVDDVRTSDHRETLTELEDRAMRAAIEKVGSSRWGEIHFERSAHPLGTDARLDRLFGFNVGPYPTTGGPNTVRPDGYAWGRMDGSGPTPPFTSEYGPSERLVVEMTPAGPEGRVLLPTGQSGNPFSPHYRDMNAAWRRGELVPLPLGGDAESTGRTVVLVPGDDEGRP